MVSLRLTPAQFCYGRGGAVAGDEELFHERVEQRYQVFQQVFLVNKLQRRASKVRTIALSVVLPRASAQLEAIIRNNLAGQRRSATSKGSLATSAPAKRSDKMLAMQQRVCIVLKQWIAVGYVDFSGVPLSSLPRKYVHMTLPHGFSQDEVGHHDVRRKPTRQRFPARQRVARTSRRATIPDGQRGRPDAALHRSTHVWLLSIPRC